jgi:hypothetical protein
MSLTELALLDGRRPLPLGDVIGLTLTLTLTIHEVEDFPSIRYEAFRATKLMNCCQAIRFVSWLEMNHVAVMLPIQLWTSEKSAACFGAILVKWSRTNWQLREMFGLM